ncbi:c-type cytochrome [Polluticoccus soli]|uniref:c-type cytochrome n=1 Tax=Polluticoccus soli TaxID=3034150 RepID=UPI0023E1E7F1|nr:cytochrome c [Flavipsychrobacter sp. JY13-12]
MNKTKSLVVASLMIGLGLAACNSGNMRRNPGRTYAPDMTYSRAYDAYTSNPNFADSQTSRLPVMGTVARGHQLPDHLMEGDTNAYKAFTTNMRFNDAELAEGGRLFNIYCGICHGSAMDGNGPLYASGKFAAMPANLKDAKYLHMPVGNMYAAIKFGKNAMGSYASQLDVKQRWQVIAYIKKTQAANGGAAFTMGMSADSTAARPTAMAADTTKAHGEAAAQPQQH